MKQLAPVRIIKNEFFNRIHQAESAGKSKNDLKKILGRGRAKMGMFEGNLAAGELKIGQVSALIEDIAPVAEIMKKITTEFDQAKRKLQEL